MLSYELRLKQHKFAIDLNISTANTAQRQSPSYPRNNRGYNSWISQHQFLSWQGPWSWTTSAIYFINSWPFPTPNLLCHKQGHTAATCWFRFEQGYRANSSPLQANMASTSSASDSSWYPDTGANVHLTNDLSNLNKHAEDYNGMDHIRVGNGQD
jgi:hypothetical protein